MPLDFDPNMSSGDSGNRNPKIQKTGIRRVLSNIGKIFTNKKPEELKVENKVKEILQNPASEQNKVLPNSERLSGAKRPISSQYQSLPVDPKTMLPINKEPINSVGMSVLAGPPSLPKGPLPPPSQDEIKRLVISKFQNEELKAKFEKEFSHFTEKFMKNVNSPTVTPEDCKELLNIIEEDEAYFSLEDDAPEYKDLHLRETFVKLLKEVFPDLKIKESYLK